MTKLLVAILLTASASIAQQTHNQYGPANALGAGQKLLAQFVGDWDVVKTFFPVGKPIVTKASCKQYMIQDGTENPGRKTVARAYLEQDGQLLLHRHWFIDNKGNERMMIELRMTRK